MKGKTSPWRGSSNKRSDKAAKSLAERVRGYEASIATINVEQRKSYTKPGSNKK